MATVHSNYVANNADWAPIVSKLVENTFMEHIKSLMPKVKGAK